MRRRKRSRVYVREPALDYMRYYVFRNRPTVLYVNLCAEESNIVYILLG